MYYHGIVLGKVSALSLVVFPQSTSLLCSLFPSSTILLRSLFNCVCHDNFLFRNQNLAVRPPHAASRTQARATVRSDPKDERL